MDFFDNWTVQVRKGLLELCVLNLLLEGEQYGYDIIRKVLEVPGFGITEGTLYPGISAAGRGRELPFQASPDIAYEQLFGSAVILNEALRAQEILGEQFGVSADVWSATSYKALYREAGSVERRNRNRPGEEPAVPYVAACLGPDGGGWTAATVASLPCWRWNASSACGSRSVRPSQ